jgi:hypothetical protein
MRKCARFVDLVGAREHRGRGAGALHVRLLCHRTPTTPPLFYLSNRGFLPLLPLTRDIEARLRLSTMPHLIMAELFSCAPFFLFLFLLSFFFFSKKKNKKKQNIIINDAKVYCYLKGRFRHSIKGFFYAPVCLYGHFYATPSLSLRQMWEQIHHTENIHFS